MFNNIFMTEYKVGKLDTISILLFNILITGLFAHFNLVNIFKFAFFFFLKALFIVFCDTTVKFNYINKKSLDSKKRKEGGEEGNHTAMNKKDWKQ